MPIIKIFGFSENNRETEEVRHKIDEKMEPVFGPGNAGTVLIHSDCRTCDQMLEKYQYLEIIFTNSGDKEKIISALKEAHLGLDIIFIRHDDDGFIPADEMI